MLVRIHPRSVVSSVLLPDGSTLRKGETATVTSSQFDRLAWRRNGRPLLVDVTPPKRRPVKTATVTETEDGATSLEDTNSQEDN